MTEEENKNEQTNPFQSRPETPPQPQQQLSGLSKSVGFEVPVESVALPSKGILYPLGSPLANQERLDIRCMSAKEEDILTSRALIKNGTVITTLLNSCLMNKSIDVDEMLTGDRNALLIAVRVTGYGSEYTVKVLCPDCSEESDQEFNLSRLRIKDLKAQPIQPNTNQFSYTLPRTGLQVVFKLLTGADETALSQAGERRKKLKTAIESSVTDRLFASVLSINGETDRTKIRHMINNLPAYDAKSLRKYMNDIEPDVDMNQEFTCSHCGGVQEVEVPLGATFFWPDAG